MFRMGRAGVFAVLVTLLTSANAVANPVGDPVGYVARVVGVCVALEADGSRVLVAGGPVFRADRIVTSADAGLVVEFGDGSQISIGSQSVVIVSEFVAEQGSGRWAGAFDLILGAIRAFINDDGEGSMQVQTRAAVASARSTEWAMEVAGDHTAVFVVAGDVEVAAAGETVVLGPGLGVDVDTGERPTDPKAWGQGRVRQILAATSVP